MPDKKNGIIKSVTVICCIVMLAGATVLVWYRSQSSPLLLQVVTPSPTARIVPTEAIARPVRHVYPTDGYGLYTSCPPSDNERCFEQLQQIAQAGFKLVVNYSQLSGTINQLLTYAQEAQALGLKIIWSFADPHFSDGHSNATTVFTELSRTCGCADSVGFIEYVVENVEQLPATWGYYIGDEVTPDKYVYVKQLSDTIHAVDPSHPRLFVARSTTDAVNTSLAQFASISDVIVQDFYPIGRSYPATAIATIARGVQAIANTFSISAGMVLQAFSLSEYSAYNNVCLPPPLLHCPYPTSQQMQQMLEQVLAVSKPRLILWYSFDALAQSDDFALHWGALQTAIHSVIDTTPTPGPTSGSISFARSVYLNN